MVCYRCQSVKACKCPCRKTTRPKQSSARKLGYRLCGPGEGTCLHYVKVGL